MAGSRLRSAYWSPHRRDVLSRIIAAIFAGYLFTTVIATFFGRLLRVTPAEAVTSALLASFLFYSVAIMWAFAARTATLAWLGLILPSVVFGVIASFLGTGLPS